MPFDVPADGREAAGAVATALPPTKEAADHTDDTDEMKFCHLCVVSGCQFSVVSGCQFSSTYERMFEKLRGR